MLRLFLPGAGSKVHHIRNFKSHPEVGSVVISDLHDWSRGAFEADACYLTPPFRDVQAFLERVDSIHAREQFDICLPIHDGALHLYAQAGSRNYAVAMNPLPTVLVALDKLKTYDFFRAHGLPTVDTWPLPLFLASEDPPFPTFLKPRTVDLRGTPEACYRFLGDRLDLDYAVARLPSPPENYVVQRYLQGQEINLDFFCDASHRLVSVVAVHRQSAGLSGGILRGEIVDEQNFRPFVERVCDGLKFVGANQLQCYVTDGRVRFTEVNARFSGSSVLVKEAGVDYFHAYVNLLLGREVRFHEPPRRLKMAAWESPYFFERSPAHAQP